LHGHLQQAVHEQAGAAFGHRPAGEVALHLRVVRSEVRQCQEEPADQTRPDVVAVLQVEGPVDRVEPPQVAGQLQRACYGYVTRQPPYQHHERGGHAQEDHRRLLRLGAAHRPGAAGDGVGDHESAHDQDGQRQIPAEEHRQNQRRRVDRQACGQAALEQEQERRQQPGLGVEPLLEVFVRGEDFQPVVDGHRHRGDADHGQRQAEIHLDEPHAVGVSLAGGGEEGDGARLGGHDGQGDRVPAHAPARQKVFLEAVCLAALVDAEAGDEGQGAAQHQPVQERHENHRWKR